MKGAGGVGKLITTIPNNSAITGPAPGINANIVFHLLTIYYSERRIILLRFTF